MFHFLKHPEYGDESIDLYRLKVDEADSRLGFSDEKVWRITLKGKRQEIGQISYRTGESEGVFYFGHIGYHIDPPWRGNHFALHACKLITDEIIRSGKHSVSITCDPDNTASEKTCMELGCFYEDRVFVPDWLQRSFDISSEKLRFIWILNE